MYNIYNLHRSLQNTQLMIYIHLLQSTLVPFIVLFDVYNIQICSKDNTTELHAGLASF